MAQDPAYVPVMKETNCGIGGFEKAQVRGYKRPKTKEQEGAHSREVPL